MSFYSPDEVVALRVLKGTDQDVEARREERLEQIRQRREERAQELEQAGE